MKFGLANAPGSRRDVSVLGRIIALFFFKSSPHLQPRQYIMPLVMCTDVCKLYVYLFVFMYVCMHKRVRERERVKQRDREKQREIATDTGIKSSSSGGGGGSSGCFSSISN